MECFFIRMYIKKKYLYYLKKPYKQFYSIFTIRNAFTNNFHIVSHLSEHRIQEND